MTKLIHIANSATQIGSGWDAVVAEVNHKQASQRGGIARSDKQRPQTRIGHGWDEIVANLNASKFE